MSSVSLRAVWIAASIALASCGGREEAPSIEPAPDQAPAPSPQAVTALDARWPPIGSPAAAAPRAVHYPGGGGLRFVIFGASWCPACVASTLEDAALARRYAGRVTVGMAVHGEDDVAFTSSRTARYLADVPIWSASSTAEVAQRCEVRFLPSACLLDGDRVVWRGGSSDAPAILDAYLAHRLDAALARHEELEALVPRARGGDAQARAQLMEGLRGLASRENSIAWGLVDREEVPPADAELAIALAQDAVDATGAMNSAILDTLAVALWKGSRREDAVTVGARVIAVCDATGARCSEERPRAEQYVSAVRGG